MKERKVIIIGLDGATWHLIKPWADEGVLPTFKKLMDNGAWGVLESTIPPATCPAWPSMLTGKKPEKLGLYYFTRRDTKSYQPRINKITFDGSIWQILTNYGKRCYVINVPLTELPKKDEIKAVFIVGPIMHAEEITNQPRIRSLIKETGYQVDPPMFEEGKEEAHLKEVINRSKKQFTLVEKLLHEDWDLFFYVNYLTDPVSHLYWEYLDETHPDHQKNERITSLLKDFYREIDQSLDLLIDKASNLFVVSDHGFGPLYYEINLNSWLAQEGFLNRRPGSKRSPAKSRAEKLVLFLKRTGWDLLLKIGRYPLIKPVARKIAPLILPDYGKSIFEKAPALERIDWNETKAYSIYYGGVNINLQGRELLGSVKPEEYESVRHEIIKRALQIRDPEGRQVVDNAWRVEEIYEDPSPTSFPDIVLKFKDFSKYRNRVNVNLGLDESVFTKYRESGGHNLEGIFLAYGPDIKQGLRVNVVKIYDIAPTILHVFGLPIPRDMDGQVRKEIFEEGSELARREITYQEPEAEDEKAKTKEKIKELKTFGKHG